MHGKTINPSLHKINRIYLGKTKISSLACAFLLTGSLIVTAQNITNNNALYNVKVQPNPSKGGEPNINKLDSSGEWIAQYFLVDYGLAGNLVSSINYNDSTGGVIAGGPGGFMLDSNGNASSIGPINTGTIHGYFPLAADASACLQASDGIRYRGADNELFMYDESDSSSWTENFTTSTITGIVEDDQRNLWASTIGDGVYVRKGGITLHHYDTTNSGLPIKYVFEILQDISGNMWISTWGGGLAKFDGINWTIFNGTSTGLGFNFNYLSNVTFDQNGTLWTGGVGFYKFDTATGQGVQITKPALMVHRISDIVVDHLGYIWVGSWDGLWRYDPTLLTWTKIEAGTSSFVGVVSGLAIGKLDPTKPTLVTLYVGDGSGVLVYQEDMVGAGIIDLEASADIISIYPNPAKESIHVLGMSGKDITHAQIISTLGQTIENIPLQPGKEIYLPIAHLPAGQYMLLLQTAKGKTYTTKFIKE